MSLYTLFHAEARLQGKPWYRVCARVGSSYQTVDYQLKRKPGPPLALCLRLARILRLDRRSIESIWRDEVQDRVRSSEGWPMSQPGGKKA